MGFDFGKTLKPGDMVALRREMNPLYEEHDYGIVLDRPRRGLVSDSLVGVKRRRDLARQQAALG